MRSPQVFGMIRRYMVVPAKLQQRFPYRLEQYAVCFFRMIHTDSIKFVQHSEYKVKIGNGQQLRISRRYPFLTLGSLTLGTTAVTARVITHKECSTFHHTKKSSCPSGGDQRYSGQECYWERCCFLISLKGQTKC